jgi:hypothetical protein
VQVSLADYPSPFIFRVAGDDIPYLERGQKVWVCFDPHEAAAGAVIFNGDTGPKNLRGYRLFERLFVAPLADDRPQWDERPAGQRGADPDVRAKKVRHAQVKAAATSVGLFGQGARRVQAEHDGRGNVRRIETGAAPVSPAPREEPAGNPLNITLADVLADVGDNPSRDSGESPIQADRPPAGRISSQTQTPRGRMAAPLEDTPEEDELAAIEAAEQRARNEHLFI